MFSNSKPSKLDKHFKSRYGGVNAGNNMTTLQIKRARFDHAGTLHMYGFSSPEKPLLLTSNEAAYQIVKLKKAHTIGEKLIKLCILKIADIVHGKEAATSIFI